MINRDQLRETIRWSLIIGVVAVSICMIGIVEAFGARDVITDRLTLGQLLLLSTAITAGYLTARRMSDSNLLIKLVMGDVAGLIVGIPVVLLIWLSQAWETIRDAFINVSPALISIITLEQESVMRGAIYLLIVLAIGGFFGALLGILPTQIRRAILTGFGWITGISVMAEILINILRPRLEAETINSVFGQSGIKTIPYVAAGVIISVVTYWWQTAGNQQYQRFSEKLTPSQASWSRRLVTALIIFFVLILPSLLGVYLTEIINNVGLFILMGLGLNIAVGMAGLLDLGYVTNFAVGAYVMALLTTGSEFGLEAKAGIDPWTFWIALPICVVAAMCAGFLLALPVIRMRGDYLAIATLGFGEIVRVLARSDWLKPLIGGAQGILQIPKAGFFGFVGSILSTIVTPINGFLERFGLGILSADPEGNIVLGTPPQLFYLILLASLVMLIISRRLDNSRTGRRWMAIREDEDVAAAMGINTTTSKIIAFTLSAASGGLAGAIFAAKLGSIFPHSFQLLISINVLSLIIVGGLGSIPGAIVGAFALIGVPELLREFAEFRLLLYGVALIVIMLVRPEGLWPSEAHRRELRSASENIPATGD